MKIRGAVVTGPAEEVVVIPLGDTEYVFKAKPVLDFESFEAAVPQPEVPKKMVRGGGQVPNDSDPKYQEALMAWAGKRTHWMFLQSTSATDDLVWETVDMADPETWGNYQKELRDAGFSELALGSILGIVMTACGLNQEKIDEATKRFLAGPVPQLSE